MGFSSFDNTPVKLLELFCKISRHPLWSISTCSHSNSEPSCTSSIVATYLKPWRTLRYPPLQRFLLLTAAEFCWSWLMLPTVRPLGTRIPLYLAWRHRWSTVMNFSFLYFQRCAVIACFIDGPSCEFSSYSLRTPEQQLKHFHHGCAATPQLESWNQLCNLIDNLPSWIMIPLIDYVTLLCSESSDTICIKTFSHNFWLKKRVGR